MPTSIRVSGAARSIRSERYWVIGAVLLGTLFLLAMISSPSDALEAASYTAGL